MDIFWTSQTVQQRRYIWQFWEEIYTLPYHVARDTKLQAFQFKLIHCVLPCKKYLVNIHIKADATCSYCDSVDTLQHFFYTCQPVYALWNALSSWLTNYVDLHIQLDARTLLFGIPRSTKQSLVINFVILSTKFYIYRQRLFHHNRLEIIQVLCELHLRLRVEKHINSQERKPGKFRKWERFLFALG